MKTLKNQLTFCFLAGIFVILNSFSFESKAEPASGDASAVKSALDKARGDGQATFVVVTGNGVAETSKAVSIAEGAKAIYKNAVVVQMNRDDLANAQLVNEWRLSGAPLPLILAVSPKGILTGGLILAQATAENIAALVPSPKKEEVISHLSSGKSVFLVISNNKMVDKNKPISACQQACVEMKEKARIVNINTDDPKELSFLKELKINTNIKQSMTYVINEKGQVTGTFNGDVNSATLVASATKIITSSCCPAGSSQTCAPAK